MQVVRCFSALQPNSNSFDVLPLNLRRAVCIIQICQLQMSLPKVSVFTCLLKQNVLDIFTTRQMFFPDVKTIRVVTALQPVWLVGEARWLSQSLSPTQTCLTFLLISLNSSSLPSYLVWTHNISPWPGRMAVSGSGLVCVCDSCPKRPGSAWVMFNYPSTIR